MKRIEHLIDIAALRKKTVGIVGVGGGANISRNLIRSGLGRIKPCDMDTVEDVNICRQEHMADQIGMFKVHALEAELKRIDSAVVVDSFPNDFCAFADAEIDQHFGDCDLLIAATDSHDAQAKVNTVALRLNIPVVFIGLYPSGQAGEIAWWRPGAASCYRCLLPSRYAVTGPRPAVNGGDIFSLQMLDAIAGSIVLGLLTQGADNRYGKLIDQLGDRQFLQVKMDPSWAWNGRDIVREMLGVGPTNENFFSFCTIARRDPDPGGQCPDCVQYRNDARVS